MSQAKHDKLGETVLPTKSEGEKLILSSYGKESYKQTRGGALQRR